MVIPHSETLNQTALHGVYSTLKKAKLAVFHDDFGGRRTYRVTREGNLWIFTENFSAYCYRVIIKKCEVQR